MKKKSHFKTRKVDGIPGLIDDIVRPGEMLDVIRDLHDSIDGIDGVVVVTLDKDGGVHTSFAGVDVFKALGCLVAAQSSLLEDE